MRANHSISPTHTIYQSIGMGKRKGPLAATKKKGGLSTGDFKKRTAKVGKRAVKQANVTKVRTSGWVLYRYRRFLI